MERELEFKLLDLNLEKLKEKIIIKGAELIAHEKQINTVIDSSKFPLIEKDSYLRIREIKDLYNNSETTEFTFKRKVKNKKARENYEYTTEVSSKENLIKILENLQLDKQLVGTKERCSYKYKNLRLDFDYWDKKTYPYPYIEVEALNEEELYGFLEEFEINKSHISLKSITDLQNGLKSKQQ